MPSDQLPDSWLQVISLHALALKAGVAYCTARRAFNTGKLLADGQDSNGRPIFFSHRLEELKNALTQPKTES